MTKGITKKDLKTILTSLADSIKTAGEEIDAINLDIDQIEDEARFHIQKMGYLRFNPFSDTGGNQSFCLCLLDDNNDGIVITSLHSRDQTRIYSKTVKSGKADGGHEFSKEEEQAVAIALMPKKKGTNRKK